MNIKKLPSALKLSKWTKKIIKISADQLIFSSCYLFVFFMGIGILQGLANKYDEIQDINNNITMINSKMIQMNVHSSGSGGVDKNIIFHEDSSVIYDNFNLNDSKNNNNNNSNDNAKNIDSYDNTYNEYVRLSNLINDLKPLIIRLEDHLMTKHQDGEDSHGNNNSNNQNKTSSEADINASVDSSIRGDRSSSSSVSSSGDDLVTHSEQSIDTGIYDDDDDDNNNSNTNENESLPISLHILKSIREKLFLHESSQQQHQHHQQQQKSVYQHNHSHDNDDQSHHLSPSYLSSRHKKEQQLSTKTTTTTTTTPTIIPLLPTPQLEQFLSLFDTNILSEVIRNAWKRTIGVYLMTYVSDSIVWPPLQLINFSFVPVRYQFLYVNTCNLFWNTFLSYVANKKNN